MRNRSGSRFVTMLVFAAILLMLLWRMHLLKSARPTPHAGAARTPVAESTGSERRDLAWDEEQGGHTLERHVGRSAHELARRLELEGGVAAASSFVDRETAERVVASTLAREEARVQSWLRREKENLALDYRGESGRTIGTVLLRGESTPRPASDARVVLRKRGARFFVLTAYPVEP
jgi:hypothetical protein